MGTVNPYSKKQQTGIKMAINKTAKYKEFARIGVHLETKEKFDNLVDKLNHENQKANGKDAAKITKDDVLNELLDAYLRVGV